MIHVIDFGSPQMAKEERDDRVSRAINAIPDDLKAWATPLLEASTPPIARHRLLEIIKVVGSIGQEFAGGHPDEFVQVIIATRNVLVHPGASHVKRALDEPHEIFWFARALHWLGLVYLLKKLGLNEAQLAEVPKRSRDARGAVLAVRRLFEERVSGSEEMERTGM